MPGKTSKNKNKRRLKAKKILKITKSEDCVNWKINIYVPALDAERTAKNKIREIIVKFSLEHNKPKLEYSTTQQRRLLKIDTALQNEKKMKIGALFMKMKI